MRNNYQILWGGISSAKLIVVVRQIHQSRGETFVSIAFLGPLFGEFYLQQYGIIYDEQEAARGGQRQKRHVH
ncbi:hypothetical protein ASE04_18280 [Rhizobium sp. Root708]|nr:hypothetical protein ASE04_18280 [Rhizobium sp. Root708]